MGGRGGFEEEVEDGCGRLTDEVAAAPSKRRRSRKRDKATTNNDDDRQYTTIKPLYLKVLLYRFQINCTFLPKSEIFYTADVNNLCSM